MTRSMARGVLCSVAALAASIEIVAAPASSPWCKSIVAPRAAMRPAGKARRPRISGIYLSEEQRSQTGCSAGRMQSDFRRGRDDGRPPPPAQIRTGRITAYGSYLGCVASKRTFG